MKISKETFEKEISLCQEMYKKKAGCTWGKCKSCGVLPFLWKLHKGILLEDRKEIEALKKSILTQ